MYEISEGIFPLFWHCSFPSVLFSESHRISQDAISCWYLIGFVLPHVLAPPSRQLWEFWCHMQWHPQAERWHLSWYLPLRSKQTSPRSPFTLKTLLMIHWPDLGYSPATKATQLRRSGILSICRGWLESPAGAGCEDSFSRSIWTRERGVEAWTNAGSVRKKRGGNGSPVDYRLCLPRTVILCTKCKGGAYHVWAETF